MSLNNKKYNIDALAEANSEGFTAAQFPQIRDALARSLMSIYGSDIDLSSASADGQLVNMEALVFNNIYRTLESIENNMSPSSASGKYLDVIASLSNTFRKGATYSTAQLYVKYIGTTNYTPKSLTFIDKNGDEWIWFNKVQFDRSLSTTFEPDGIYNLTNVKFKKLGANQALGAGSYTDQINKILEENPSYTNDQAVNAFWTAVQKDSTNFGDIYQAIEYGQFIVYQASDAVLGANEESDSSLRSRRLSNSGNTSLTLIQSLKSKLLDIDGIQDCYIFNGVTTDSSEVTYQTMLDLNQVSLHNVFVVVRLQEGITEGSLDREIAETIYKSLTPGVLTQQCTKTDDLFGKSKSYDFQITDSLKNTVYWKEAGGPVYGNLGGNQNILTLTFNTNVTALTDTQKTYIKQVIINYLNNLELDGKMDLMSLISTIQSVDQMPNGISSYFYNSSNLMDLSPYFIKQNNGNTWQMGLCYFKLTSEAIVISDVSNNKFTVSVVL